MDPEKQPIVMDDRLALAGPKDLPDHSLSENTSQPASTPGFPGQNEGHHGWNGPNDPENPYNWSSQRKLTIAVVISFGQLIALMSASMTASALGQISRDLGIDESTTQITFSIYLLGLGFAPFLIAPMSEMYGRRPVWLFCSGFYVLWNALCPVGQNAALMIVARFLAASGASVGITLTGPILADMYGKEERGKSLAIAAFVPYLGPALGPIIGGILTQTVDWPWLFYVLSIFAAGVCILTLVFVPETYTPVLLARRRKAAATASGEAQAAKAKTNFKQVWAKTATNLNRPIRLLYQRPIILLISLVNGVNFAVYILLLSTFAPLWQTKYGHSPLVSSLHYIAIALGTTLSAQVGAQFMDWIFARMKARSTDGTTTPEFRVPCMVPGVILMPAGLFWYGWTAQFSVHWAVVDVAAAMFVLGSFLQAQAMLAYVLDEFEGHAASANAASKLLSYVLGFVFPIFAPQLYQRLDYGWGNSLLGFVFIVLGCPMPLVLWKWGTRIRALKLGNGGEMRWTHAPAQFN